MILYGLKLKDNSSGLIFDKGRVFKKPYSAIEYGYSNFENYKPLEYDVVKIKNVVLKNSSIHYSFSNGEKCYPLNSMSSYGQTEIIDFEVLLNEFFKNPSISLLDYICRSKDLQKKDLMKVLNYLENKSKIETISYINEICLSPNLDEDLIFEIFEKLKKLKSTKKDVITENTFHLLASTPNATVDNFKKIFNYLLESTYNQESNLQYFLFYILATTRSNLDVVSYFFEESVKLGYLKNSDIERFEFIKRDLTLTKEGMEFILSKLDFCEMHNVISLISKYKEYSEEYLSKLIEELNLNGDVELLKKIAMIKKALLLSQIDSQSEHSELPELDFGKEYFRFISKFLDSNFEHIKLMAVAILFNMGFIPTLVEDDYIPVCPRNPKICRYLKLEADDLVNF